MIGKLPKRFANGKATRTDCSSGPTHRTVSAPVSTAFPVNAAKYTSVRPAGTFTPRFKNTEHTAAEETTKNQPSSNMHTHQTTASNGTTQNSSPPSCIGTQEESGKRSKFPAQHRPTRYRIQAQRYLWRPLLVSKTATITTRAVGSSIPETQAPLTPRC